MLTRIVVKEKSGQINAYVTWPAVPALVEDI